MSLTKTCSKCKKKYPPTEELFYKDKRTSDGLRTECKTCHLKHKKKFYEANIPKFKKYRRQNREKNIKYHREYRKHNKEVRRRNSKTAREKVPIEFRRFYNNLHNWIRKNKPIQEYCTICNKYEERLELANISGLYKRDIDDFLWLCSDCHHLFDMVRNTHEAEVRRVSLSRQNKGEID